jgi:hypothetical protein
MTTPMHCFGARFALVTLLAACGGTESEGTTTVEGAATYRDATTNHDGTARQPSAPPPSQDAKVRVIVKGTGEIPQLDPQCALDPVGAFEARYAGTLELDDDGIYAASIGEAAGEIVTPSGCAIPDLTVGLITDVVVRGELTVNTQNCETYCEANARAEAEAMCGATATAAQCRSTAETQGAARCNTTCTTQADTIVAEVSVGAGAIGEADLDMLRAAALGELTADLEFDRLEDAGGAVVEP